MKHLNVVVGLLLGVCGITLPTDVVSHHEDGTVETCHVAGGQIVYPGSTVNRDCTVAKK